MDKMKRKSEKSYIKELGKEFVGLWKYQMYNNTMKKPPKSVSYCVTVCVNGNHIDTHAHKKPIDSLKEGIKIIKKFRIARRKRLN